MLLHTVGFHFQILVVSGGRSTYRVVCRCVSFALIVGLFELVAAKCEVSTATTQQSARWCCKFASYLTFAAASEERATCRNGSVVASVGRFGFLFWITFAVFLAVFAALTCECLRLNGSCKSIHECSFCWAAVRTRYVRWLLLAAYPFHLSSCSLCHLCFSLLF